MAWSEERREQQRAIAKELVAQGKFGGKGRGQGRPRKRRASEVVAERVNNEGDAIFERLMEITRDGKDANSIMAASKLLDIEERERKIEMEEEEQYELMRGNDLAELIHARLMEAVESGAIETNFDFEGTTLALEEGRPDSSAEESGRTSEAE